MYVLFNGFVQPIEVVAEFLGYTEKEILLDDSLNVYHEVWKQTAVDDYDLDMQIMTQYERLLVVYPIRVYNTYKEWKMPAGWLPENDPINPEMIRAMWLLF